MLTEETKSQFTDSCCNQPPTTAYWAPRGEFQPMSAQVGGIDRRAYRVGPKDSKLGVVAVIDIHGFHPNTLRFFDTLSERGFQVSIPDWFVNGPMPDEYMGNRPKLFQWVSKNGDYRKNHLDELIKLAAKDLLAEGCTDVYLIGVCYGTFLAIRAASEADQVFKGVAGPHPSGVSANLAKDIKAPLLLLPSSEEPDMQDVVDVVLGKGFQVKSVQRRFDNMHHGFCGGRGDWDDPAQLKAGLEALTFIDSFFQEARSQ
ncbi:hypothetical protein BGZ73_000439 [Actinomortierella ambigua]|nr:hypothetical protein BGZ73_000439 [Actinomortierella ambigua]